MIVWIELDAGLGWTRPEQIVLIRKVTDHPDQSLVQLADGTWVRVRMSPADLMKRLG